MSTAHRLRKHADYQHAYARSRKQFTKQMAYFAAPRPADRRSDTPGPRVGLTVPKALGKAHDRNRIKRRLRAVVAANLPLLTAPVDVILHPRRSVLTAEFAVLEREIAMIFRGIQSGVDRAAKKGSDGVATADGGRASGRPVPAGGSHAASARDRQRTPPAAVE